MQRIEKIRELDAGQLAKLFCKAEQTSMVDEICGYYCDNYCSGMCNGKCKYGDCIVSDKDCIKGYLESEGEIEDCITR